jgi:excisionase family DNA binding protein
MTQPDTGYPIPDAQTHPTMRVWPDTGRALKLSKASTYEAVSKGEIPSIRIGRRLLVPTAALRRMLGLDPT